MHLEPAAVDREFEARAVLGRAAAVSEQKWLVDLLDVDAALNRLDPVGDFEDSASGFFRVGIGACGGVLHAAALPSLSTPRATTPDAPSSGLDSHVIAVGTYFPSACTNSLSWVAGNRFLRWPGATANATGPT